MKVLILLIIFCTAALPVSAGSQMDTQTDVSFGYSFLSSEGDSPWFRNHYDSSDGFLLQNLKLNVRNPDTGSWFETMSLEARAGDRLGTGRVVRFSLKKTGRYSFTLKQSWNRDYFNDDVYNYGANNRNLTRNYVSAEFRWTGFRNFALIAGYGLVQTKGAMNQPFTEWNDIYALRLNRDTDRQRYTAGLDYHKGALKLIFRQSWVTVDEKSRYQDGTVTGEGFSTFGTVLTPLRSGRVKSTIPISSTKLEYSGRKWWASVRFSHSDATIDNDVVDLKQYVFSDYGSRTDFLMTFAGNSDAPTNEAGLNMSVQAFDSLVVSYDLSWRELKTDTTLNVDRTMLLYGTSDSPLVTTSDSVASGFYYRNRRLNHGLSFKYSPKQEWDITLSLRQLDGHLRHFTSENGESDEIIDEDYTTNHVELSSRYRLSAGNVKASVFHESIDNPVYRTAGDKRNGYSLSGDWMISDSVSWNMMVQNAKLKNNNPGIQLDRNSTLLDTSLQFSLAKGFALGIGYTMMKLDFSNNLLFNENEVPASSIEAYNTNQKGVYAFGTFSAERLSGRVSFFYLDDTGSSFPLSHWNGIASCQYKLTKTLYGLLSLRYYDYNENASNIHDYNVNQFVVGIRWLFQ
ncbi:MAG: hypothetical protein GXO69_11430 [Acidobacteria bacterium]|nr:hypothetical protein [Acidobacteriota bacterium]